jgi:hypothetical protein
MATKIQWKDVVRPIDSINAEVKANTGVDLKANIAKRRARNPFSREFHFVQTAEGYLPLKTLRNVQ